MAKPNSGWSKGTDLAHSLGMGSQSVSFRYLLLWWVIAAPGGRAGEIVKGFQTTVDPATGPQVVEGLDKAFQFSSILAQKEANSLYKHATEVAPEGLSARMPAYTGKMPNPRMSKSRRWHRWSGRLSRDGHRADNIPQCPGAWQHGSRRGCNTLSPPRPPPARLSPTR